MSKDTGGAAFPSAKSWWTDDRTGEVRMSEAQEGMTLRDYFAAVAMQGMLAGFNDNDKRALARRDEGGAPVALAAYMMADAMLKARQQQD